jgi:hypothetical protein
VGAGGGDDGAGPLGGFGRCCAMIILPPSTPSLIATRLVAVKPTLTNNATAAELAKTINRVGVLCLVITLLFPD